MPPRPLSRGALGAVVFAGAAALAVLGLPSAGTSVGVLAGSRPLAATAPSTPEDAAAAVLGAASPSSPVAPGPEPSGPEPSGPEPSGPAPALPTADPEAPTAADGEAGILRRAVAPSGSGTFDVVPGSAPAPGTGVVHTLRVEVEHGLPVDGDRFAAFVMTTLNDPRSWGHGGAMTFARTDGDAPVTLVLASPDTSSALCGGLDTRGRLSCRNGPRVVLTFFRWVTGTDEYAADLTGYRRYLVNHEVGHALGHGHELCPGPGRPAPVMQQQTLGLKGCAPNSWPHPEAA